MEDPHICTCGDCEVEPLADDRCKYELGLRRLVEYVDGAVSGVIPKQELARAKQVLGMEP